MCSTESKSVPWLLLFTVNTVDVGDNPINKSTVWSLLASKLYAWNVWFDMDALLLKNATFSHNPDFDLCPFNAWRLSQSKYKLLLQASTRQEHYGAIWLVIKGFHTLSFMDFKNELQSISQSNLAFLLQTNV